MGKLIAVLVLVLSLLAYVIQLVIFLPTFILLLVNSFQSSFSLVMVGASLLAFAETSFSPVVVMLLSLIVLRRKSNEK